MHKDTLTMVVQKFCVSLCSTDSMIFKNARAGPEIKNSSILEKIFVLVCR